MTTANIHLRSLAVNAANISRQVIDGDEHTVIRGVVPVIDDVVMNGGLYPAAEINASFKSIEGNLMPLSHPRIEGRYVSAHDPRAVNKHHGGAWAQNVRKDGDRVVMDVYVNRRVAAGSEDGQRLLDRLDAMQANTNTDPIHISTGLLLNKEHRAGESRGKAFKWVATNMRFDHVAILLDEPGAATPDDGVGIFANADGTESDVELAELAELITNNDPDETAMTRFINKLTALFGANHQQPKETDPMKDMIVNALTAKGIAVDGKSDAELFAAYNELNKPAVVNNAPAIDTAAITAAVNAAVAPLNEKLTSLETQLNASANAELDAKRAAVKTKYGWTDAAVNSLAGEALDNLFATCQTSVGLNGAFKANTGTADQWADYDINAHLENK